jgi:hypothetical protein
MKHAATRDPRCTCDVALERAAGAAMRPGSLRQTSAASVVSIPVKLEAVDFSETSANSVY